MKISVFIKRNIRLFLKNRDYITKILGDIKSGKSERGGFKKNLKKQGVAMRGIRSLYNENKTFVLLFFSVLAGILILRLFLSVWGKIPADEYRILNKMCVEVQHEDGTVDRFDSHFFNFSSEKDRITIRIPLEKSWKKEHQSINFFFYNSEIKAYYKDELLASYGTNLKRHMIGHIRVAIPVPEEAFGEEIRVEITPKIHFMENNFDEPVLMSERDALFFSIIGLETSYAIFVMTLIATFIAMVAFAVFSLRHHYAREGFWLTTMIFAITFWHLGNSGMMYMLTDCEDLNAVSEYLGMYLLLSAAPLYASHETERPRVRRFLKISGGILFSFFVLTLFLYFLPTGYTYVWHLRIAQGVQIVMLLSTVLSLMFPGRMVKNNSDRILGFGLIFVALLGIMEQVRLILSARVSEKWPRFMQLFVKIHYSKVMILVMIFVFITAFSFKLIMVMQKAMEDEHLRVLAFTDNLSGMGNRQFLQRKIDLLDSQRATGYAVIFMDINDLKYTNDHFGHDCGDKLIKMVSTAIKGAVDNANGFCGRSGGDEFLAVIFPEHLVVNVAKQIREDLEAIKEREKVPFPVSLSIGVAGYSELAAEEHLAEKEFISADYVIRKADKRMYKDKCRYREQRDKAGMKV